MINNPDNEIQSPNITLYRDQNAFGHTLKLRERDYAEVLLIQPTNEWFLNHWEQHGHSNRNEQNLLYMLEAAYAKGCSDTRSEIKKALGIP